MDINIYLLQWSINAFIKKTSGKGIENENISNKRLAEKVHKPVISKCNKKRVQSPFIDNLCS